MEENKVRIFDPAGVVGEAFSLWRRNLIPVVAVYSVTIFLSRILRLSRAMAGGFHVSGISIFLTALFIAEIAVVAALNSYLVLLVLSYLKASRKQKPNFSQAAGSAFAGIVDFLRAGLLLAIFILVLVFFANLLWVMGKLFYAGTAVYGFRLGVVLGMDTLCVVFFIAAFWYGFFFGLAPLIAAFEKKGPWISMQISRARMKGHALRCVFIFLFFVALYLSAGLTALFVLKHFGVNKRILNLVDPGLVAVFGPLGLAIWLGIYEKLSEGK